MTQSMRQRAIKRLTVSVAALSLAWALQAATAYGQTLAGRWMALGRTLDNGEQQKSILELKQDGSQLTGELKMLGYSVQVKGTATGNHFELFAADSDQKRPMLVGDLVNGELHAVQGGRRNIVAKPAGPGDDIPPVAFI
jgi:alpha-galactosidase